MSGPPPASVPFAPLQPEAWFSLDAATDSTQAPSPQDLEQVRRGLGISQAARVALRVSPHPSPSLDGGEVVRVVPELPTPAPSPGSPPCRMVRERAFEVRGQATSEDVRDAIQFFSLRSGSDSPFALFVLSMETDRSPGFWLRRGTLGTLQGAIVVRTEARYPTSTEGFPDPRRMKGGAGFFDHHDSTRASGAPGLRWAARSTGGLLGRRRSSWDLSPPGGPAVASVAEVDGGWEVEALGSEELFDPVLHCLTVVLFTPAYRPYLPGA